jgi:hypothetical protein
LRRRYDQEHCGPRVYEALMAEVEVSRRLTELTNKEDACRGIGSSIGIGGGNKAKTAALHRRLAALGPNLPPPLLTTVPLRPGLPLVAMVPSQCRGGAVKVEFS